MTPPRHVLPIESVIVKDRQRDLNPTHVESLAEDIRLHGLIQPIVINQEGRLIAGAHRLAACKRLNFPTVDVVYKETLSEDDLAELELTEDVKRLDRTWQERCCAISKIHALKKKNKALEGQRWGERETGELLNLRSGSAIHWSLFIADLIAKGDKEIIEATSLKGAWDVVMRREEESIMADLAKGGIPSLADGSVGDELQGFALPSSSLMAGFDPLGGNEVAESGFEASSAKDASLYTVDENQQYADILARVKQWGFPSLNQGEANVLWRHSDSSNEGDAYEAFDTWYARLSAFHSQREQDKRRIPLSRFLFNRDCIPFMLANLEAFDAIITDIPYGIDMDMLNQGQDGHAFKDIATVEAEHTVEGNETLMAQFFPAAYAALKPNTYLITWADQMQFQYMYDLATAAGFKCQRWPLTWVKLHPCMNQTANTNFTKTTEIAIVCRKGVATLTTTNIPCHILAAHDDFKINMGHPFVKPFDVWRHLIESVTVEGHTILEPFAGHGSGVISMLRLKRRVIACELNTNHYNALLENVKQHYLAVSPNFTFS